MVDAKESKHLFLVLVQTKHKIIINMLFYLNFYILIFPIDNYYSYLDFIIHTLLTLLPLLIVVAFFTLAERKAMASIQRRRGPDVVGL